MGKHLIWEVYLNFSVFLYSYSSKVAATGAIAVSDSNMENTDNSRKYYVSVSCGANSVRVTCVHF